MVINLSDAEIVELKENLYQLVVHLNILIESNIKMNYNSNLTWLWTISDIWSQDGNFR